MPSVNMYKFGGMSKNELKGKKLIFFVNIEKERERRKANYRRAQRASDCNQVHNFFIYSIFFYLYVGVERNMIAKGE